MTRIDLLPDDPSAGRRRSRHILVPACSVALSVAVIGASALQALAAIEARRDELSGLQAALLVVGAMVDAGQTEEARIEAGERELAVAREAKETLGAMLRRVDAIVALLPADTRFDALEVDAMAGRFRVQGTALSRDGVGAFVLGVAQGPSIADLAFESGAARNGQWPFSVEFAPRGNEP